MASVKVIVPLVLIISIAGVLALSYSSGSSGDTGDWRSVSLKDVSTGESYTISELDKPVILETFAVWCPTCTRQQQELAKFHEKSNVTSVSLDVDPNEDEAKIKQHIERNDFDWRYSVSPPDLTRGLIDEFGNSVAQPPLAPMILVCENGSRRLQDGVKPVSKISKEVQKGC